MIEDDQSTSSGTFLVGGLNFPCWWNQHLVLPHLSFPDAPWCWNIYLHLPQKSPSHVGKYSIHGAYGFVNSLFVGWNTTVSVKKSTPSDPTQIHIVSARKGDPTGRANLGLWREDKPGIAWFLGGCKSHMDLCMNIHGSHIYTYIYMHIYIYCIYNYIYIWCTICILWLFWSIVWQ